MIEQDIQNFYSKIKFPGTYTTVDFDYYDVHQNRFLKPYVDASKRATSILEIGCGTGYITNLLAYRNKHVHIDAIDFSDSIDVAKQFSDKHKLKNITYHKTDFLKFYHQKQYDLIISNGVLHHIPNLDEALSIINSLSADEMVLGIYNKFGKLAKRFIKVNYTNDLLRADQEESPYEVSFTDYTFRNYFPNYVVNSVTPGTNWVNIRNIFNYKNGGLTVYHFCKNIFG